MRTRAASRKPQPPALDPRAPAALLQAFLDELRVRGYSKGVQRQATQVLPRFFSHLREKHVHDLRAVTEEHLVAYARELQRRTSYKGTPLTAATQRSYLGLLQRFFLFLDRRGVMLHNPALDLPLPKASKLPRVVLSEAQVRRLIAVFDSFTPLGRRNRALVELLYGTGLRLAECEQLDLRDLDLAHGTVFVRQGKGRKDRVVPIAGRATAALEVYQREVRPGLVTNPRQQALFIGSRGGRLGADSIQLVVRKAAKAAGIEATVTPHTLRHSYATHLLKHGADVRHVQRLLGHSALSSTAIYTRVLPTDLAEVMAKAHPRERTWRERLRRLRR